MSIYSRSIYLDLSAIWERAGERANGYELSDFSICRLGSIYLHAIYYEAYIFRVRPGLASNEWDFGSIGLVWIGKGNGYDMDSYLGGSLAGMISWEFWSGLRMTVPAGGRFFLDI